MRRTIPLTSLVLLAACGGATPRPAVPGDDVITMEEMRIVATTGGEGETLLESYDAGQLFERGTALLQRGQCREAVERYYDRIISEFPSSRYVSPALYNAGLCLHEGGELEASIPYYEGVLDRAPQSRDARHATLQLAQVLLGLERFDRALAVSERALLREDLSEPERLEGLTRRGQALLGLGRYPDAERQARDALSYYRMQERRAAVPDPYFAAASNYVLAETMRMRSEDMDLPEGSAQEQHAILDQRARLVLDAQREYFNTIRHTNAEWAAAAGYRIGSMYDHLWRDLMQAPIPPPTEQLDATAIPIYETEYRSELARHIRPLLRHAIRYWELTLLMVERTGVRTEWADRTRDDLERMRALLLDQTDPVGDEEAPEEPEAAPAGEDSGA
ncbi:MAG: tetratricopeptide repeat protein [Myxococcales bacterium]|nr:tetratricopeptide repeat protein [Myxococcales bacterium]